MPLLAVAALGLGVTLGLSHAGGAIDLPTPGVPQSPAPERVYEVLPVTQFLTEAQMKQAFRLVRDDPGFGAAFAAYGPELLTANPLMEARTHALRGAVVVVSLQRPIPRFAGDLPALTDVPSAGDSPVAVPTRPWVIDNFGFMYVDVVFDRGQILAIRPGSEERVRGD